MPMTKDLAAKKVETKVLTMQKGSGSVKTRALLQSVKNEATKGSALQLGGRAWMPLLIEESDAELLPESDLEVEAEGAEIPKPEALDELHQKSKKAAKKVVKMTKSIVLSRATTVDDSATMVSDTPSLAAENAGPSAGAKAGNPPKAPKGYTYIPVIPSEEDDSPLSSPSSPDNRRVTRSRKARH
ncbi:hypothetical protein FRC19_001818 [Serendipita sp. 401]|nr:hypothetical protein FRC19_001818 [Serendipita sp. 401]